MTGLLQFPSPHRRKRLKTAGQAIIILGLLLILFGSQLLDTLTIFGYFLGAVGFFVLGYIFTVDIYADQGVIKVRKGLFVPLVVKSYHKSDFESVIIRREVTQNSKANFPPGTSSISIYYTVILKGPTDEQRLDSTATLESAQLWQRQVAEALNLPIVKKVVAPIEKQTARWVKIAVVIIPLLLIAWVVYLALTVV
ncbi:hypothetical protein E1176_13375 [Fulvivirga sp. RKSG066]|uniref:hypothetical protein n=1 Tax=Fulvivirga aurantia TaxID=2529383 RepID=UPI0012BD2D62|nr:hypothetical protein [Fulvivirga aurantia]MTI22016.1 hypothetical protein [Fulvivirga aurantia]